MMKFKVVIIFFLVMFLSSCTSYESELESIQVQLKEIEESNVGLNKINERIDGIEKQLKEIYRELDDLEDDFVHLDNDVSSIDLSTVNNSIYEIESDIYFIEEMIWRDSLFDIDEVGIGDRIGNMEIIDIKNYKGPELYFKGEVTVRGRYELIANDPMLPDGVAFYVDDLSSSLPREHEDYRILWFMFDNPEDAITMMSKYSTSSEIEIVIDDYVLNLVRSSVYNSARLIEVVSD